MLGLSMDLSVPIQTLIILRREKVSLLSISMDLSNSTRAKTEILRICRSDELREKQTKQLFDVIVQVEKDFYFALDQVGLLEKVFLVKSLGDELWYILDLADFPPTLMKEKVLRLLERLQIIADKNRTIVVTDADEDFEAERKDRDYWRKHTYRRISVVVKVTTELIKDAYNFVVERQKVVSEYYKSLTWERIKGTKVLAAAEYRLRLKEWQQNLSSTIKTVAQALNLGTVTLTFVGEELETIHYDGIRYDLFGRDVDKFFRICKAAIPGLVMCGPDIFREYLSEETFGLSDNGLNMNSGTRPPKTIEKVINSSELKGIEENVSVYYLPYRYSTEVAQIDCRPFGNRGYEKARALLLKAAFLKRSPVSQVVDYLKYKVMQLTWNDARFQ